MINECACADQCSLLSVPLPTAHAEGNQQKALAWKTEAKADKMEIHVKLHRLLTIMALKNAGVPQAYIDAEFGVKYCEIVVVIIVITITTMNVTTNMYFWFNSFYPFT